MSLDWDLTRIKDHETVCWHVETDPEEIKRIKRAFMVTYSELPDGSLKVMESVTNVLILAMVQLGCKGEITEKNVEQVIDQMALLQRDTGALLLRSEGGPFYVTPADVRKHIGLRTNVTGAWNTPAAFRRRAWEKAVESARKWLDEQAVKQGEPSESDEEEADDPRR